MSTVKPFYDKWMVCKNWREWRMLLQTCWMWLAVRAVAVSFYRIALPVSSKRNTCPAAYINRSVCLFICLWILSSPYTGAEHVSQSSICRCKPLLHLFSETGTSSNIAMSYLAVSQVDAYESVRTIAVLDYCSLGKWSIYLTLLSKNPKNVQPSVKLSVRLWGTQTPTEQMKTIESM